MDKKNQTKSISIVVSLIYLPVVLFFMIEYFRNKLSKNSLVEYIYMFIIASFTLSFLLYTILIDDTLLSTEIDNNVEKYSDEALKHNEIISRCGIILFLLILFGSMIFSFLFQAKIKGIMLFFIYSVVGLCNLSYIYERTRIFKINKFNEESKLSFNNYFTKGLKTNKDGTQTYENAIKSILPGLVFGLVFGFIDNAGLISGLEALDEPFGFISKFLLGISNNKLNSGGSIDKLTNEKLDGITSGFGNLFSDGLGVSLGAFFGKFASSLFPSDVEQPIWVDMVGISLGCILGIIIPISFKNLFNGIFVKNPLSLTALKDFIVIGSVIGLLIYFIVILPKRGIEQLKTNNNDDNNANNANNANNINTA